MAYNTARADVIVQYLLEQLFRLDSNPDWGDPTVLARLDIFARILGRVSHIFTAHR